MNTTPMKQQIQEKLTETAREHDVSIVNARERGSRRINAEHDDSDYDVFFLFHNEPTDYALVGRGRTQSIHAPDDPIDLHGWDVRKFGELLSDSNPDAIDYCRTETEYISARGIGAAEEFEAMAEDAVENANLMALYHHWLSMAESNYKKYVADDPLGAPINRQFHVARAVANAAYIRNTDELPPLDVDELVDAGGVPAETSAVLEGLLDQRRAGDGETVIENSVEEIFYDERSEPMNANDERTKNPNVSLIDQFIGAVVAP
jgi:predicted nucleotidyltransferase